MVLCSNFFILGVVLTDYFLYTKLSINFKKYMNVVFKGTGIKITPALEEYAGKKIKTLQKLLSGVNYNAEVFVELGKTTGHHKKGDILRAEIMVVLPGQTLRATQEDWDIHVAIDKARDEMKEEISKYKGRFESRNKKEARFLKILKNLSSLTWTGKEKAEEEKIIKEEEKENE